SGVDGHRLDFAARGLAGEGQKEIAAGDSAGVVEVLGFVGRRDAEVAVVGLRQVEFAGTGDGYAAGRGDLVGVLLDHLVNVGAADLVADGQYPRECLDAGRFVEKQCASPDVHGVGPAVYCVACQFQGAVAHFREGRGSADSPAESERVDAAVHADE